MSAVPALLQKTMPYLGLVHGMSNEEYRAVGGLSYSGLKLLARSPFHFQAARDERAPKVERAGQLEGTLAHCLILEPDDYPFRYAIGPEVSRASREWKDFVGRQGAGRVAIKPSQEQTANRQAASVRALPDVAKLLRTGKAEVSAFWRDPVTGVLCQCRPDWVHPVQGLGVILVDLKTYGDASPGEFERQVMRKKYHWQAAHYTDGFSIAAGVPVLGFVFVAVESDWPHAACAVMLDDASMDVARAEIAPLVKLYARCTDDNVWPGYSSGIEQITLPRWYTPREAPEPEEVEA